MNSRVARTFVPRLSSNGLMVLVIVLAFSFVAIVLIPGLETGKRLGRYQRLPLKFSGQQQTKSRRDPRPRWNRCMIV